MNCKKCDRYIAPIAKGANSGCKLEMLSKPCEFKERFVVPHDWQEQQAKNKRKKR